MNLSLINASLFPHDIIINFVIIVNHPLCTPLTSLLHSCTIQGSVICSHVHVEEGVSLKDCHVGANYTVTKDGNKPHVQYTYVAFIEFHF